MSIEELSKDLWGKYIIGLKNCSNEEQFIIHKFFMQQINHAAGIIVDKHNLPKAEFCEE